MIDDVLEFLQVIGFVVLVVVGLLSIYVSVMNQNGCAVDPQIDLIVQFVSCFE